MKTLIALSILTMASIASARTYTTQMTCEQARALVLRDGYAVLYSSPSIYDRYVTNLRYCIVGNELRPAWVPTRDRHDCYVGSTCHVRD